MRWNHNPTSRICTRPVPLDGVDDHRAGHDEAGDFDVSRLDQLVDDGSLARFAERAYPSVADEVREDRIHLPYTFVAVLRMVEERDLRVRMVRNEGHIPEDASDEAVDIFQKSRAKSDI